MKDTPSFLSDRMNGNDADFFIEECVGIVVSYFFDIDSLKRNMDCRRHTRQ